MTNVTPPTARTYPAGVPCWVDTEQPDPPAAAAFYGGLFGWEFHDVIPADVPGTYLIATLDGHDVGAVGPMPSPDVAATWNTYIAVDDADAMVDVVARFGGAVVEAPVDAGPGGRGATFTDPQGVPFKIWQPYRRLGAQLVNAPGSWNFSDLHAADPEAAAAFYGSVFGWELDVTDAGDGVGSRMWRRPGYADHLASTIDPGIHERQAAVGAPPEFADAIAWLAPTGAGEAAHWHVTFAVADRDAAVATALSLGATDVSGPVDTSWTRAAVVRDPQGATFTLSQFTPGG